MLTPAIHETRDWRRWITLLRFSTARLIGFVLLTTLLGGCAGQRRNERAYTAAQIEERTHQTLPPWRKPPEALIPDGVKLEDGLSEEEAVAIALWNNAAFQATVTELGFASADLIVAGLLSNPSFSILFPLGPKQLEFAATFPLEALWLRPKRVSLARMNEKRVAESLIQNGLDLVRNVQVAYSDSIFTQDRARLAEQGAELWTNIAALAQARLRAGDISELETTSVRVEALRAIEEAKRATHDRTIARDRLHALLGLGQQRADYQCTDIERVPIDRTVDELVREALAARPDLRAAELGMEAAGKRAGLARAEIFALSGIIDANASGKQGFEIGPGAQLPIPIFNRNQGAVARAKAELEWAAWNYAAVRNQIDLEVRESYTKLRQANDDLEQWRKNILPPLEEAVRQAQKSYEVGEMSLLLVHENSRQLLSARVRQAEVAADFRRARAELERSVGHRLEAKEETEMPK